MKVTYFIGNGFDINAGLDTKANVVVEAYLTFLISELERMENEEEYFPEEFNDLFFEEIRNAEGKERTEIIHCKAKEALTIMRESISSQYDKWSDYEKMLGQITEKYEDPQQFIGAYRHFREFLFGYLERQEKAIEEIEVIEKDAEKFYLAVKKFFFSAFRSTQQRVLRNFNESYFQINWEFDFVSFNYTKLIGKFIDAVNECSSIDKIVRNRNGSYKRELKNPIYIHGSLSDYEGILVGVNDASQIANESFREIKEIRDLLIKPIANAENDKELENEVDELIKDSTIIVVYGMSLGETDSLWWQKIGAWLQEDANRLLIISKTALVGQRSQHELYIQSRDQAKNLFFEVAGVSNPTQDLAGRLLISFGPVGFDFSIKQEIEKRISDISQVVGSNDERSKQETK